MASLFKLPNSGLEAELRLILKQEKTAHPAAPPGSCAEVLQGPLSSSAAPTTFFGPEEQLQTRSTELEKLNMQLGALRAERRDWAQDRQTLGKEVQALRQASEQTISMYEERLGTMGQQVQELQLKLEVATNPQLPLSVGHKAATRIDPSLRDQALRLQSKIRVLEDRLLGVQVAHEAAEQYQILDTQRSLEMAELRKQRDEFVQAQALAQRRVEELEAALECSRAEVQSLRAGAADSSPGTSPEESLADEAEHSPHSKQGPEHSPHSEQGPGRSLRKRPAAALEDADEPSSTPTKKLRSASQRTAEGRRKATSGKKPNVRRNSNKGSAKKRLDWSGLNAGDNPFAESHDEPGSSEEEEEVEGQTSSNRLEQCGKNVLKSLFTACTPIAVQEASKVVDMLASETLTLEGENLQYAGPTNGFKSLMHSLSSAFKGKTVSKAAKVVLMLHQISFFLDCSRRKLSWAGWKGWIRQPQGSAQLRKYKTFNQLYDDLFKTIYASDDKELIEGMSRDEFVDKCSSTRILGEKWCWLVSATSVHILVLVACVTEVTPLSSISLGNIGKVAQILRRPHYFYEAPYVELVIDFIVPTLRRFSSSFGIQFHGLVRGRDAQADLTFFSQPLFYVYRPGEWDESVWGTPEEWCQNASSQTILLLGRRDLWLAFDLAGARTIKGQLGLQPTNKREWTERERERLSSELEKGSVIQVKTKDQLEDALKSHFVDGAPVKGSTLFIDPRVAKGCNILLRDRNGEDYLFIMEYRSLAFWSKIAFNAALLGLRDSSDIRTSSRDGDPFNAVHYSWTYKYCHSGRRYTPKKGQSGYDIAHKNSQRYPHPTAEMTHDTFNSQTVLELLQPICTYISSSLRSWSNDKWQKLLQYKEQLPLGGLATGDSVFAGLIFACCMSAATSMGESSSFTKQV
ncbi:hypothetical protein BKA62DRAFT_776099 [Auriculariales sp. MPI-PUGE-AT-0066]|nr:hypothetical protein BKA62DRAFT_776099 [Auriculariales sp. MPI-PUGE-AT-0066]